MRWSGQLIEEDEQGRLPGRIGEGVVRTFDAPEALDTRFYEVRAKSALNRVPRASRMPFEWTVNPYRGCAHACTYCADGATPILMAGGRTRPLAELRPGDHIYGTAERDGRRRYATTQVLDHWVSMKPAFRVTLADGTELVTSGDHRFLTETGWRYVNGRRRGRRWPRGAAGSEPSSLTLDSTLMGTGGFAPPPPDTAEYRRGYLCGLARAVGRPGGEAGLSALALSGRTAGATLEPRAERMVSVPGGSADTRGVSVVARGGDCGWWMESWTGRFDGSGRAARAGTPSADVHPQRPFDDTARARGIDHEALRRAARFLRCDTGGDLTGWPARPSADWSKGLLAALFDVGGVRGQAGLRLVGPEAAVIEAAFALDRLGFGFSTLPARGGGEWSVQLRGGAAAELRFLRTVDPAVTWKRSIEGRPVETSEALAVTSIEPVGPAATLYDITTGTGDFISNGVVSHNCFARPTHEYLDLGAGRDFEREIVVKVNVPEVLRAELARPSWRRQHVAMGTNTDPYQWVEGRYKLMRGIWEALRDASNPCSILTKSPLVLRDVDLLQEIAERTDVTACLSVPTLDEKAWRASEPRTPNPRARLEAVAELNRAGIPTGILIAPLMPGINDAPEQVEEIIALATEAGAAHIGGITLHLRGAVREVFFDWLRGYRPDLVPYYERLYARGAYVAEPERRRIERAAGLPRARLDSYVERFKHRQAMRTAPDRAEAPRAAGGERQPTLF